MNGLCAIIFIGLCARAEGFIYDPKNSILFNNSGYFGYSVYLELADSKRFQLLSAAPKDDIVRTCNIDSCQTYNIPQQPSKINFFGATITGTGLANKNTVVCNPLYANQLYHANGVCFIKQKTFQTYSPLSKPSRQIGRYNGSLEYLYTHGQLGFSIKYIQNEGFLFGAPGVLSWKGTILKYSFDGDDAELNPETKIEKLSYLGYSVEYGSFNFRGRMIQCVVAGAPKGSLVLGQVYIFAYVNFPNHLLKIFNGNQFGGYFGHSLMVSGSDLFVGAPMYNLRVYEEGCVYIFFGSIPNLQQSQRICGQKPGGRFGFAMTHLGRIGTDLFNVVVISAPYEEENSGAIYLYTKLDDTYKFLQKISGKSVIETVRGFGFSLSNSLDIDRNFYNDFAVGAYLSSSVVIFKSKPVVRFFGHVVSNVSHIQDDISIIGLQYCFKYIGYNSSLITTKYEVIADDRVEIQNINNTLMIQPREDRCVDISLRLRPHAHYNPYPLNIKILNKLEECPNCTVAYPNDTTVETEIPSATGCGNDGICTPDLKLSNSFQKMLHFVVGSRPSLPLIVDVQNTGETAYHCKLNLTLTAEVNQIPAACSRHENIIICDISNRFGNQQKKTLQFEIDMQNYYNYSKAITGEIRAFSVGEGNGKMVNNTINLSLVFMSNLTLVGYSSPEYLVYNQERNLYFIHHEYVVFNNGPSPLTNQYVTLMIPQNVSDMNGEFQNIFDISTAENLCASDDSINTPKTKRDIQQIDSVNLNTVQDRRKFSLDCSGTNAVVQCKKFICDLELLVNHSVKIDFGIVVNLNFLVKTYQDIIQDNGIIIFESSMQYNHTSPRVYTVLYQPVTKKPVAIWVWIISVILAILILALIVYGLYRMKFFKRRDMQALVNEEEEFQNSTTISGSIQYILISRMAECDVVQVLNPPPDLIEDRKAIYDLFGEFGKIVKVFTDNQNYSVVKIYYTGSESASNAVKRLHKTPPRYLELSIKSEIIKRRSNNHSFSTTFDEASSTHSNMHEDEIVEISPARYYDIFGKEICTFVTDSGQVLVSVEELKRHNFPLFPEEYIPQRITKKELLQELYVYISYKVRKFLSHHNFHIQHTNDIDSVINRVMEKYTDYKPENLSKPTSSSNKPIVSNHIHKDNMPKKTPNNNDPTNSTNNQLQRSHVNSTISKCVKENSSPNVASSRKCGSEIRTYSFISVPLNTPLEVSVTCALNDHRCYVYLKMREPQLINLLQKVQIEAEKSKSINPEIGGIYAAQYDGEWYRAIVLDINPLKVQYIDFGNKSEKPLKEVRPLSKTLSSEPAEGICINFGNNPVNIPLDYGTILNIVAVQQNSDKSYQVKKLSDSNNESLRKPNVAAEPEVPNNTVENSKQLKTTLNMNTATAPPVTNTKKAKNVNIQENKIQKNGVQSPIPKVSQGPPRNIASILKQAVNTSKIKYSNPPRNTIMDMYTTGFGVIQYLNTIQGKHIYFVLPTLSLDSELNDIESITNNTSTDKTYKANPGDCVAVFKEDEAKWVRATVINSNGNAYTVALIDYGAVETSDAIRKLPKVLADIPEFCCICTGSAQFLQEVKNDTLEFEILEKNKFKVSYSDGSTENIICSRWDPFIVNDLDIKSSEEEVIEIIQPVFTLRPNSKVLSSNELVIIVNFNDGKLLVRTKEMQMTYNRIKSDISQYAANPLKQLPCLNQIVLCPYENSEQLYRGIVTNINENSVEIEYIDLGFTDSVNINTLRSISKPLVTVDITIIPVTLKGFENGEYNDDALLEIQKLSENRTKFIVQSDSNDVFDLLVNTSKESLSKTLRSFERFFFKNLPKQDLMSGKVNVVCINIEQIEDKIAHFVSKDKTTVSQFQRITDASENIEYSERYIPSIDEVCFTFFEDEWFRARILTADPDTDQFKVTYIDYGNEAVVSSSNIRKLNENLKGIAPVAMSCKINNFNNMEISTGNEYHVQILHKEKDGFYIVDLVQ